MEKDEIREDELEQEIDEVEEEEEEIEEEENEEEDEEETDWKAEALKYKAIATRKAKKKVNSNINSNLKDKAEAPDEEVGGRLANLELAEKKRQFGYENGLSPVETDRVFQFNPNPTAKTLKDPFIKAGLQAVKRQERVANNMPSTSAKATVLDRKALKDKTPEEKQEAFEKYMKGQK